MRAGKSSTESTRQRILVLFALLFASAAILVVESPVAQATVPANFCIGKSYKRIVKTYTRNGQPYPLRCGKASWGFRHIAAHARWNDRFDRLITQAVSRGQVFEDVSYSYHGTKIFVLFYPDCSYKFVVRYNGDPYLGNDVDPQGIYTAHYYDRVSPVSLEHKTSSRRRCPFYSPI